jgi:hypothetical protein
VLTFLKTAAIIACMVLIIPLCVWGGSGSFRHGLEALKQYLTIMGVAFAAVGVLALITSLP